MFGEYFLRSIGVDSVAHPMAARIVSATAILVATTVNIRGVALGAAVVGATTVAKVGGLVLLVVLAVVLGRDCRRERIQLRGTRAPVDASMVGLALISVLWAYDGFADVTLAGGEVSNPQRNLPRSIVMGTLTITAVYLAVNVAYLYVSPIGAVAQSPLIAADTMTALVGRVGASFISVVVMLSTFGALMAGMLATPRVFFAMAEDRLFFQSVARVHPRYGTPYVAIGIAGLLGALFVLTQTFEQLADTFVLSIWPFYTLAIAGLYVLRRSQPNLARPYRVVGYPVTPAVFIVAGVGLLANAVWAEPVWTSVTFGVVLAGAPMYWVALPEDARLQALGSGRAPGSGLQGFRARGHRPIRRAGPPGGLMFKKLFSKPETARHLVIARLNDRAQPMDRGDRYEDPLDAFLKANGLGEVSGGGTQLLETGEIE